MPTEFILGLTSYVHQTGFLQQAEDDGRALGTGDIIVGAEQSTGTDD